MLGNEHTSRELRVHARAHAHTARCGRSNIFRSEIYADTQTALNPRCTAITRRELNRRYFIATNFTAGSINKDACKLQINKVAAGITK